MNLLEISPKRRNPTFFIEKERTDHQSKTFGSVLDFFVTTQEQINQKKKRKTLTGVLTPCRVWLDSKTTCFYKLRFDDIDVPLLFSNQSQAFLKRYLWDDVKVSGYYDEIKGLLTVDRIYPVIQDDGFEIDEVLSSKDDDFETLQRKINQYGKIDPQLDEAIAS